jgi:hypothetical protein
MGGGRVVRIWLRDPVGPALPLLACFIVFAAPQMADMMAGMKSSLGGSGASNWRALQLAGGVFLLGLQGWYWSRAALNAREGYPDAEAPIALPWPDRAAPRLVLVPTTLIALSPIIFAWRKTMPWDSVSWPAIGLAAVVSAVLWTLAVVRRMQLKHGRLLLMQTRTGLPQARPLPVARVAKLLAAAPWQGAGPWTLLGIALVGIIIIQSAPDFVNRILNTPTASMVALSCLVPVASILLAVLRDLSQLLLVLARCGVDRSLAALPTSATPPAWPLAGVADIIGAVMLVALPVGGSYVFEYVGSYNVPRAPGTFTDNRKNVVKAIETFTECHKSDPSPNLGGIPAIIVATEGGASRSAAWTLSVMHMLDARTGGMFGSHIFAISSVSGGSLGAVTYDLAQVKKFGAAAPAPADQLAFWRDAMPGVIELARADLLSSAIATMFTSDMLLGVPRRGPILAQAFDDFWRKRAFALDEQAGLGLVGMREGHPCLPHLILNGTDVETGGRLMTSTIAFGQGPLDGGDTSNTAKILQPFADAVDLVYQQQADFPASAAVLNSARFPLISPPGHLPANVTNPTAANVPAHAYEVIDGGVFDNYSARTAWELAGAIKNGTNLLDPIVVLITNDFDPLPLVCSANPSNGIQRATGAAPGGIGIPEIVSSLLGLYEARGGHARTELVTLRHLLCDADPWHMFHFDLRQPQVDANEAAPMNWVLDENSCRFMLGNALNNEHLEAQAKMLTKRLRGHDAEPDMSANPTKDAEDCDKDVPPAAQGVAVSSGAPKS